MDWSEIHSRIRNLFADLYGDESSARRMAADAGIDIRQIDFSGKAIDFWENILRQAERTNRVASLFNRAHSEYNDNPDLAQVEQFYAIWVKARQSGTQPNDRKSLVNIYDTRPQRARLGRSMSEYGNDASDQNIFSRIAVLEERVRTLQRDQENGFRDVANRFELQGVNFDRRFAEITQVIKAVPPSNESRWWWTVMGIGAVLTLIFLILFSLWLSGARIG